MQLGIHLTLFHCHSSIVMELSSIYPNIHLSTIYPSIHPSPSQPASHPASCLSCSAGNWTLGLTHTEHPLYSTELHLQPHHFLFTLRFLWMRVTVWMSGEVKHCLWNMCFENSVVNRTLINVPFKVLSYYTQPKVEQWPFHIPGKKKMVLCGQRGTLSWPWRLSTAFPPVSYRLAPSWYAFLCFSQHFDFSSHPRTVICVFCTPLSSQGSLHWLIPTSFWWRWEKSPTN